MEEIRLGLELNDYGMQQRRIAHMRFLGELYNYEHVDSSVIFETLYLIIVFGQGTPEVWICTFFIFVNISKSFFLFLSMIVNFIYDNRINGFENGFGLLYIVFVNVYVFIHL